MFGNILKWVLYCSSTLNMPVNIIHSQLRVDNQVLSHSYWDNWKIFGHISQVYIWLTSESLHLSPQECHWFFLRQLSKQNYKKENLPSASAGGSIYPSCASFIPALATVLCCCTVWALLSSCNNGQTAAEHGCLQAPSGILHYNLASTWMTSQGLAEKIWVSCDSWLAEKLHTLQMVVSMEASPSRRENDPKETALL